MVEQNILVEIADSEISKVNEYLGNTIELGKQNQTTGITKRIRMTWATVQKLRNVFNSLFWATMTFTVHSENRMRTTQRCIVRAMSYPK